MSEPTSVQDFYERHPYPHPLESLDKYRELWNHHDKRRADYHLFWPAKQYREDHSILIAGCGTSQAAKYALRWPQASVVGIDFSKSSLDHSTALKEKHELNNLELRCLPVERAGDLETEFDHIVSTGVLHHLPAPEAGLRALRSRLKPDGAMHLMVYAPYGRTGIYMLQDFCRRLGITPTDEGIRDLVAALEFLPPGHPLLTLLNEAPDFQYDAAIADALLNPQDRAYSVPELFEFLPASGMKFGRWLKQAPYSAQCGTIAQLPQSAQLANLPHGDQFAAIELFRGTMVTHSVIAYRDDAPKGVCISDFSAGGWKNFVPIRRSDTLCLEERLPAGASAVLIDPGHPYRDLYLPIAAEEKSLFDAIDGRRTIGEIADELPSQAQFETTREFFERLWLYDQIVFDASRPERT